MNFNFGHFLILLNFTFFLFAFFIIIRIVNNLIIHWALCTLKQIMILTWLILSQSALWPIHLTNIAFWPSCKVNIWAAGAGPISFFGLKFSIISLQFLLNKISKGSISFRSLFKQQIHSRFSSWGHWSTMFFALLLLMLLLFLDLQIVFLGSRVGGKLILLLIFLLFRLFSLVEGWCWGLRLGEMALVLIEIGGSVIFVRLSLGVIESLDSIILFFLMLLLTTNKPFEELSQNRDCLD